MLLRVRFLTTTPAPPDAGAGLFLSAFFLSYFRNSRPHFLVDCASLGVALVKVVSPCRDLGCFSSFFFK